MSSVKRIVISKTMSQNALVPNNVDIHTEGFTGPDEILDVLLQTIEGVKQGIKHGVYGPNKVNSTPQVVTVDLSQVRGS